MQVPERLALIGGSILLSSTLIFTLKSQASSIIPNVSHSISGEFDHIGDAQRSSDFDGNYQDAKKNGETTGNWGTSKYYIDKDDNLHVGAGNLNGTAVDTIGQDKGNILKTVNFDQPVQAPNNSIGLLAQIYNATSINGIENLNTSQVKVMEEMFANDSNLRSLNLSNWDTSQVKDIGHMFNNDKSLSELNISNLSNTSIPERYMVFNNTNIKDLTLNSNFQVRYDMGLSGTYKNGNQTLSASQLQDDSSHPGTWVKQ